MDTDRQPMGYSLRVRLMGEKVFYGPGVAELLRRVDGTGSLQTAAAGMGMSYSKAWKIVRTAEAELGFSLMERHVGGPGGGFSRLTEEGKAFAGRYEKFQREVYEAADRLFARYFGGEASPAERNGEKNEED